MACFHPLMMKHAGRHSIVPCGRCIGCRLVKKRSWAIRCMHEASMHEKNCFLTLTYDDEHYTPSLNYTHFQQFMRNLRLVLAPQRVRFFMAGEYGETTERPHYHALLFGIRPTDAVAIGKDLYTSKTITAIWGRGFTSFGDVTYASAAYCASYTCKKITGKDAERHYRRVDPRTGEVIQLEPEFAEMSVRPGIGYSWWKKWGHETYLARDGIIEKGGRKVPTPKYYDTLLQREKPEIRMKIREERFKNGIEREKDNTEPRMRVRERCAEAKLRFRKRETI